GDLVAADAVEAAREVLEHRLREEDVADEPVDPRALAEGKRLEAGELAAEQRLDRRQLVAHTRIGGAPRVDAEPRLLVEDGLDAPQVRRVRRRGHETLQADVLVRPQRPARA